MSVTLGAGTAGGPREEREQQGAHNAVLELQLARGGF